MRRAVERTRKAKAYKPVRTLPRISSATVDLSPGSSLPIARLLPGETSTLLFLDAQAATHGRWPPRRAFPTTASLTSNGCKVPPRSWFLPCRPTRMAI
ncbi:DotH/IcmK family type IV secretion protein [Massilia sp. B-10]|nr:DotH/IcmK family type IV secretion protein [Massilia sp. B-10]